MILTAVVENIRMFVVFKTKNNDINSMEGIFYALLTTSICKDIRLFKSRHCFLCYLGGVLGRTKREANSLSLFQIFKFTVKMTKNSEICIRAKYSTPSATADARQALILYFTENFPPVKQLRIKDQKWFFHARARYNGRQLYAKAYSLERLAEYFRREFEIKVLPGAIPPCGNEAFMSLTVSEQKY